MGFVTGYEVPFLVPAGADRKGKPGDLSVEALAREWDREVEVPLRRARLRVLRSSEPRSAAFFG
jgi:hypothetical protein